MSSWIWIAASAASLGSATDPGANGQGGPTAIAASAATAQVSTYGWDTYKMRLAALARLQGVREATIQVYVPGLDINNSAIQLERTEPVAHTFGGVVGALAPYLRTHVTRSLIVRGQDNYRNNYD